MRTPHSPSLTTLPMVLISLHCCLIFWMFLQFNRGSPSFHPLRWLKGFGRRHASVQQKKLSGGSICFRVCLINSFIVLTNDCECFCCFHKCELILFACCSWQKGKLPRTRILKTDKNKRMKTEFFMCCNFVLSWEQAWLFVYKCTS